MKAKWMLPFVVLLFSGNVCAEYYLVYPSYTYSSSCSSCHKHHYKKRHHDKTGKAVTQHRRKGSYSVSMYMPDCAGVAHCNACGEYVRSTCGRPDYAIYSAASRDCETYDGIEAGERYGY